MTFTEKFKDFVTKCNEKGIPIPVFRDPVTKLPSVTFTFFVIAGTICLLSTLDFIKIFAGINFDEIKQFFDMCCYIYVGRSIVKVFDKPKEEINPTDTSKVD